MILEPSEVDEGASWVGWQMDDAPVTKLTIRSTVAEAQKVQRIISEQVTAHGYTCDTGFAIRLSLDEALINAIRHGNGDDPNRLITVSYQVTDETARIRVCDEGSGFTPDNIPDPTLDENLEQPNGRGVMLMKAYMTEVHFNKRGNCVTLVKRRNCSLPSSPTCD